MASRLRGFAHALPMPNLYFLDDTRIHTISVHALPAIYHDASNGVAPNVLRQLFHYRIHARVEQFINDLRDREAVHTFHVLDLGKQVQ